MSSIRDEFEIRRFGAEGWPPRANAAGGASVWSRRRAVRAAAALWLGLAAACAALAPGQARADTTPPRLLNAGALNHSWVGVHEGRSAVFLVFDEALDIRDGALPRPWMFYIRTDVNSDHFIRTSLITAVNATTLRLDPEHPFFAGQTIQVGYSDATAGNDTAALQDAAGNDSPNFDFTTILRTVPEAFATAVPSIVSLNIAQTGATTIQMGWGMVPSSPEADSFDLQYAATGETPSDTDWVDGPQDITDYGSRCHTCRSYTLTGLTPGTRYWIRVRGTNSTGDGAWTEPVRTRTGWPRPPPPPPPVVEPPPDTEPPQNTEPLTAEFLNLPASHDQSPFSFQLRFSEEVAGLTAERFKHNGFGSGDVISLSHCGITAARRFTAGSDRHWEITVSPYDNRPLAIAMSASTDCTTAGAVCTADGRPLSAAVTATVTGPPPPVPERKLTVAFESGNAPPDTHDGSTAVRFNIAFSEEPSALSVEKVRDLVVKLNHGGSIAASNAQRLTAGSSRRWRITVKPNSKANIAVAVGPTRYCDSQDSVCTSDGRKLASQVTAVIAGPPGLSVADARAEEAADATMNFVVTLSRAATTAVTVNYATSNGTARSGSDYTATSGTLTFAAGDTSKTVAVPVLVDSVDDGGETIKFTLSNASGAHLADSVATGIIDNSGPIPQQWLARFGRAVAFQAVDAIEARMEGGGSHVVLGGHRVNLSGGSGGSGGGSATQLLDDLAETDPTGETRTVSMHDLLRGSSFRLSAGGEDGNEGTAMTAWGQFSTGAFRGETGGLRADGNLSSGFLGIDFSRRLGLAGLAVGFTGGDGSFALDGDADRGSMKSALTAVYPYARLNLTKKLNVWGLAGFGKGKLRMKRRLRYETTDTDVEMRMGAVGVRGVVLSPQSLHGVSLVARSDALLMQIRSNSAHSALGRFASSVADVNRVRVSLDASRAFAMTGAGRITPSLRIGMRRDGGDAETGLGAEAAGGLRYVMGRISIEVSARSLIAHGARGYREWGAQGLIRVDPGAQGSGISLTLAPRWGAAESGVDRLRSLAHMGNLAGTVSSAPGRRVEAELGYGFGLAGARGVVTPYAGIALGAARRAALTAGTRWHISPETTLALKGMREDGTRGRPEYRIVLNGRARW